METEIRKLVEQMFNHVAAFPWTDPGFKGKAKEAAKEHIINVTVRDILKEIPDA